MCYIRFFLPKLLDAGNEQVRYTYSMTYEGLLMAGGLLLRTQQMQFVGCVSCGCSVLFRSAAFPNQVQRSRGHTSTRPTMRSSSPPHLSSKTGLVWLFSCPSSPILTWNGGFGPESPPVCRCSFPRPSPAISRFTHIHETNNAVVFPHFLSKTGLV